MSDVQLTDGCPVPADRSHTEIDPRTGMQKGYVVLSPEERAKGFVKPVRRSYTHNKCGVLTTMGVALAETYARDPNFYSGTFCCGCRAHFPLKEFSWDSDGEPMDPTLQDEWAAGRAQLVAVQNEACRQLRMNQLRKELAELEAQGSPATTAYTDREEQ